jgi:hypothetical protein
VSRRSIVNRVTDIDEFWLNGGRVNAFAMEEIFHSLGDGHVFAQIMATDVSRGDDLRTTQLPDMKFVDG